MLVGGEFRFVLGVWGRGDVMNVFFLCFVEGDELVGGILVLREILLLLVIIVFR